MSTNETHMCAHTHMQAQTKAETLRTLAASLFVFLSGYSCALQGCWCYRCELLCAACVRDSVFRSDGTLPAVLRNQQCQKAACSLKQKLLFKVFIICFFLIYNDLFGFRPFVQQRLIYELLEKPFVHASVFDIHREFRIRLHHLSMCDTHTHSALRSGLCVSSSGIDPLIGEFMQAVGTVDKIQIKVFCFRDQCTRAFDIFTMA